MTDINSTDVGIACVSEALSLNSTLREVKISRSSVGKGIGGQGLAALAQFLEVNTTITTLSLWGSRIGDDGAQILFEGLAANRGVTALDLGWNEIGYTKL